MPKLFEQCIRRWIQHTTSQKALLAYLFGFIVFLLILPILTIQNLDDPTGYNVWFLGTGMGRLLLIISVILLKLILLNSVPAMKKHAYTIIGRNNNEQLDNIMFLSFLLVIFLSISETIGFFTGNLSTVVKPTVFFLLLELYLFAGILWQAAVCRIHWKQSLQSKQKNTSFGHEIDLSKKQQQFESKPTHKTDHSEGLFS